MTKDEIQTGILRVCKVANWDGDFNVVGFHALCDALVQLGAAAEREACAQVCEMYGMPDGTSETARILALCIRARTLHELNRAAQQNGEEL